MKVLGICSYKGTNYFGWQKQVGFISVQEKIEECLSKVYDTQINIQGSGRTDAGVHALKQYFHFVTDKEKDLKQLAYALNKMLPDDIKIISFTKVDDDFHARYNAKAKIYEYRILLTRTHNYQDFTSKEEDEGGFIRTIYNIDVVKENDLLKVTFNGNGFMRYQIRNMIGSAINVASGKEPLEFIDNHLKVGKEKREIIAYKAPASGLYLVDVIY